MDSEQEAESGKMQLQGDADVVDTMIKFLYTFAYVDNHISEHDRMPFSIHAFTIADQYDIIPMKEQAAKRFTELTHGTPAADAFSHAVELIYRNTLDREGLEHKLRQDAVEYAWTNYHELMGNDTGFKRVLDEVVGFGSSMVAFQMEQREPTAFATKGAKDYGCSSCGYAWSEDLPEKLKNRMKRKKASRKIPEECPDCGDDDSVYLA